MIPHFDVAFAHPDPCDENKLLELIENALVKTVSSAQLKFPEDAEVSILLSDDMQLQELNREWRGKDKPTNVLSFPQEDLSPGEPAGIMLGDIAISMDTARKEADLENKPFDDHFSHLIVHGFLHLFGYDHETEEQAQEMEKLETEILSSLGIPDPYLDHTRL